MSPLLNKSRASVLDFLKEMYQNNEELQLLREAMLKQILAILQTNQNQYVKRFVVVANKAANYG